MPATPAEFSAINAAHEAAHRLPARALAELILAGDVALESNEAPDGPIGCASEAFVLQCARDQGVTLEEFQAAVAGLGHLGETLCPTDLRATSPHC